MPNLQGASLVGRDSGDRSYVERMIGRSRSGLVTSWDEGFLGVGRGDSDRIPNTCRGFGKGGTVWRRVAKRGGARQ